LGSVKGERYLDFVAGIAVASLGYSNPHLIEALTAQSNKLWHTSNLYQIPDGERLAQRLVDATFADMAFFTNSGAEALEFACKTARKFHASEGHPERFHIITFEGAFHGRTIAMIAAGGNPKYIEGFGPKAAGFDQVPFGDLDAVKAAIGPQTAAILIEPIQGEGGIRVADPAYLRALRALCDEHGLLLVFDEVQTGVGRTGKFFAYELTGVTPDILAFAKGIGGGFPLGGCLATARAAKGMTAGTHGTTYGGNPLAMAVGNAVLDIVLAPGFLDEVQRKGIFLRQKLAELRDRHPDIIAGFRGEGLMMGVQTKISVGEFVAAARDAHMLTIPAAENVARLLPPLNISEDDLAEGVKRLDAACVALEKARATEGAPA
ncbi:MAG: aspartate aminotransferase family protein, partial [Hyphomicrobiales bacterium]|nr:aspartate aminotransferase family protein [Hyphomicrobiales bacterium]